jgi:hypothetical protein
MDPFIAYLLIKRIQNDRNMTKKQTNKSLVIRKEKKIITKLSCSNCGQNSYWCQCPNSSSLFEAGLQYSTMSRSQSFIQDY